MGLPPANLILFFLSAFTGLWGVSVLVRGTRGRRIPGSRACPECGADMRGVPGRRCHACEFEARSEEELERRKRDFRVLAVGALALASGVALVPIAIWVRAWEGTGWDRGLGVHPVGAMFWGVAAFGVVLVAWAVRGDRSRGRRRCPKCWYDMSATRHGDGAGSAVGLVCPECGHDAGTERALYRAKRKGGVAWLGVAFCVLGVCGQTVPRALRVGPLGLVPTTVLIAGVDWLPIDWLDGNQQPATLRGRMEDDSVAVWQVRWVGCHAESHLSELRDPRRLALFLALARWGDARGAAQSICHIGALLLGPDSEGWTAQERDRVLDALSGYIDAATWNSDGTRTPIEIPGEFIVRLLGSEAPEARWLGFKLTWNTDARSESGLWEKLWELGAGRDRRTANVAGAALSNLIDRNPSSLARWMQATHDEDASVRAAAASILKYRPPSNSVIGERLLEMVREDDDITVVVQAVEALAVSEVPGAIWAPAVEAQLLGQRPHRALLAESLVGAWDPPPESFELLRKGCADRSPAVRAASIWAMRRLVGPGSELESVIMDDAVRLLDDPDPRVHKMASIVLQAVVEESPSQGDRYPGALERAKAIDTFGVVFDEAEFEK